MSGLERAHDLANIGDTAAIDPGEKIVRDLQLGDEPVARCMGASA